MILSRLFVYPVKSLAGIELQHADVDDFGIVNDRRWMVVDDTGQAVTQRDHARMALIQPALQPAGLQLSAPGMSNLFIEPVTHGQRQVTVWNDTVAAEDCGPTATEWLSAFLQCTVHLVHMPAETFRRVDANYSPDARRVSFADAFPFLIISQESLDELNRRLTAPVGIERFRPNLVVAGAASPHAEDDWRTIRAGPLEFDLVKPCARCAIPTIDPRTATRGKEPNRTLAGYRRRNGKVYFGQNAIHHGTGSLSVGSPVTLIAPQLETEDRA